MSSRKLLQVVSRQFSTSIRRQTDEIAPGYDKLKAKQELFQKDNGLPVHIKGGAMDQILYRVTMLLCIGGSLGSLKLYYDLAFPPT